MLGGHLGIGVRLVCGRGSKTRDSKTRRGAFASARGGGRETSREEMPAGLACDGRLGTLRCPALSPSGRAHQNTLMHGQTQIGREGFPLPGGASRPSIASHRERR